MHVKRVVVSRYGPLEPVDTTLGPFTVVHGPNERGKTLLIDALIRMLFRDDLKKPHLKLFGNLSRVGETPEGYLVISTAAGEVKLDAGKTIADVAPSPISPEDFRNVFLIRDSDLDLRDEAAYYERVTEQLCGTRSRHIEKIIAALRALGRLRSASPDSVLTRSKGFNERLESAEKLLDEMNAARQRLEAASFDAADRRLVDRIERRAALEVERERFRAAAERARLAGARTEIGAVRERLAALASFDGTGAAELGAWRRVIAERDVVVRDIERLEANRDELAGKVEDARAALETARSRSGEGDGRREAVRTELAPALEAWGRERDACERAERTTPARIGAMIVAIGIGAAAAVAAFVTRAPFLAGAVVACAAVAGVFGTLLWKTGRAKAALAEREQNLAAAAARLGLSGGSAAEVSAALADLQAAGEREIAGVRDAEANARARESELAAREGELADRRARVQALAVEEASLRAGSRRESLEVLEASVAERVRIEAEIDARLSALRTLLPSTAGLLPEAAVAVSEREVERRLAELPDPGAVVDPEAAARTAAEYQQVVAEEQSLRHMLEQGRHELRRIEFKIGELGILDESPRCRSTRELELLAGRVAEYCESVRRDQRLAQEAIRIFQEIEVEEREKVGELFGEGAMVSKWFHEISGHYRAVHFEPGEGEVEVEFADGKRLPASALSGGAFDQLYLAIRASIAERMFPDTKGFFLLDDPFLKADRDRLRRLMSMLRRLVDRGWQVIYFTAKDEVVDALRADIKTGGVELVELERSLFSRPVARPADPTHVPRLF